jgi:hypothetical protein
MPASGYILVLLSLSGNPTKPHTVMKKFEMLESCQAAARAAAGLGTLADCLPQAERQGSTTKQREDTGHPGTRPPSK